MIGLSIDPGLSTGMCLFEWDDATPFRPTNLWQFGGGASGLATYLKALHFHVEYDGLGYPFALWLGTHRISALIVEKFTPRPNENFSHTQGSTEPLRGEGVLIGMGADPFIQWREPSQQYFMGGATLAEKKKNVLRFLETHDMKPTGKDVGQPDADDAISAELHAISWLRRQKHMPTLIKFFPPSTSL